MLAGVRRAVRSILPKVVVKTHMLDREFMFRYIQAKVDPAGTVLEIGSGVGGNVGHFAGEMGFDAKNCVLIEACPDNFALLAKNHPGARLLNVAVAETSGTVPFYVVDDPGWEGSSKSNTLVEGVLEEKFKHSAKRIDVKALSLPDLCAEERLDRIELFMINCEGAEYFIFKNGIECLRNTRFAWLELHGFSRKLNKYIGEKERIFDQFEAAGFTRVAGAKRAHLDDAFAHTMVLFERLPAPAR
jgi:FkbM family methyltransferase